MRSKIDPMQLISQLANVIMDIIAGKSQESSSETRLRFLTRHTCKHPDDYFFFQDQPQTEPYLTLYHMFLCYVAEEEINKLSNALKILSDAEKHLRASKNQTTWLTVALLQLSNTDSSSFATNENGRNQRSKGSYFI